MGFYSGGGGGEFAIWYYFPLGSSAMGFLPGGQSAMVFVPSS